MRARTRWRDFCYRDRGFRLRALSWAGREVVSGDFLDIVAEPGVRSEVLAATLEFLWTARSEWSLLVMGELIEGGDSDHALERQNAASRCCVSAGSE